MRISENRSRRVNIDDAFGVLSFETGSTVDGMDYGQRGLQVFQKRIRDIGATVVRDAGCLTFHVFHKAVQVIARVRNTDHAQGGAVPQSARIQLSHSNIEVRPQPVFQTAYNLPFVFERLRRFDVQFDGEKSNQWGRRPLVDSRWQNEWCERPTANDQRPPLSDSFRGNFFGHEGLDDIANLDVAVVGDGNTAFHPIRDLAGIVFEAAERSDLALEDNDIVA
jgi:hypothetical protein